MTDLLDAIVLRCLERDGLLIRDPEQPWLDLEARDALDARGAASIQYWIAVGPHSGRKALTLKLAAPVATSSVPKPFTVARDGFSLNVAVACAPHQRDRIERLCRDITRPALVILSIKPRHLVKRVSLRNQGLWYGKNNQEKDFGTSTIHG